MSHFSSISSRYPPWDIERHEICVASVEYDVYRAYKESQLRRIKSCKAEVAESSVAVSLLHYQHHGDANMHHHAETIITHSNVRRTSVSEYVKDITISSQTVLWSSGV